MRRFVLPMIACLALLLVGGPAEARTPLDPGQWVSADPVLRWLGTDTWTHQTAPDLPVTQSESIRSSRLGGGSRSARGVSGAHAAVGAAVSTSSYVVNRKTAFLHAKVREARLILDK